MDVANVLCAKHDGIAHVRAIIAPSPKSRKSERAEMEKDSGKKTGSQVCGVLASHKLKIYIFVGTAKCIKN